MRGFEVLRRGRELGVLSVCGRAGRARAGRGREVLAVQRSKVGLDRLDRREHLDPSGHAGS